MNRRIRKLWWKLLRSGGFDILLTHAPGKGMGDGSDLPHQGFEAFPALIEKYDPKYMVHGHVHMNYSYNQPRQSTRGNTQVINAFERFVFEY